MIRERIIIPEIKTSYNGMAYTTPEGLREGYAYWFAREREEEEKVIRTRITDGREFAYVSQDEELFLNPVKVIRAEIEIGREGIEKIIREQSLRNIQGGVKGRITPNNILLIEEEGNVAVVRGITTNGHLEEQIKSIINQNYVLDGILRIAEGYLVNSAPLLKAYNVKSGKVNKQHIII